MASYKDQYSEEDEQNRPENDGTLISVVVPLLNEEESLPELSLLLEEQLDKLVRDKWEVLFIDDGSNDNSLEVIRKIHERNAKYKAYSFRRNYGKSAALCVGFKNVKGEIVIVVEGNKKKIAYDISALEHVESLVSDGYEEKEAIKMVAKLHEVNKSDLYKEYHTRK